MDTDLLDQPAAAPREDSLRKRYLYKVGAGSLSMALGGLAQALAPRGLGPVAYGDFNFLNNFFLQVTNFLDMGTSIGFYTKLSRRPREPGLFGFYLLFVAASSIAILALTLAAGATPLAKILWPDQGRRYILMGALLGILLWVMRVLNKACDAYGLTVPAETARVLQKILGLAVLAPLVLLHRLDLGSYFAYQYLLAVFLIAAFLAINSRNGYAAPRLALPKGVVKTYAREFYQFSHPLVVHSAVGLVSGIAGRWLLQVFAGSVQQGYYGLSDQVGALCFLFSSSMTPLLTREFSIAHGKQDMAEIAALFRKHIPVLYSITAFFCCFLSVHADDVVLLLGGRNYIPAGTAMALLTLAPIHQTYGQLSGAVFYATDRTGLYRNIGIGAMLAGLVLSYFFLAPASLGGLHLGAAGLAAQLLLTQFIAVNVQLYFNAKLLGLPFGRYVGHQILCVAALLGFAWAAKSLIAAAPGLPSERLVSFIGSGLCYTALAGALARLWPRLFGLSRAQMDALLDGISSYIPRAR